ncbi:MAG: helix-turn-helix domain-containing protein [Hyphomicrobiaceae bacterium]|nr:TetR/AcrR family transcriptional regulator [Hyphomicrobiaceae bacterium]
MNDGLISGLNVDGLKPAHQKRSRDLIIKLVDGGLEMLSDHDFDTLSIERLCAHTQVTIGSFYARFDSKEAFVLTLQRVAVEQARSWSKKNYVPGRIPNDSLAHLLAWFVKGTVNWYRRNEGLVRASLRKASSDPRAWTPIRELGRMQLDQMLPHINWMLGTEPTKERDDTVRFAFQVMNGTLNNMVLINPGPFSIHHPETPHLLARAMLKLIENASKMEQNGVGAEPRAQSRKSK